jgi:hypothetical protein
VRVALGRHVLAADYATYDVRPSALGGRAATRGAAAAHLRAVLDRPWLVGRNGDGSRRRVRAAAVGD